MFLRFNNFLLWKMLKCDEYVLRSRAVILLTLRLWKNLVMLHSWSASESALWTRLWVNSILLSPPRGTDTAPRRICTLHHYRLATSILCLTPSPMPLPRPLSICGMLACFHRDCIFIVDPLRTRSFSASRRPPFDDRDVQSSR